MRISVSKNMPLTERSGGPTTPIFWCLSCRFFTMPRAGDFLRARCAIRPENRYSVQLNNYSQLYGEGAVFAFLIPSWCGLEDHELVEEERIAMGDQAAQPTTPDRLTRLEADVMALHDQMKLLGEEIVKLIEILRASTGVGRDARYRARDSRENDPSIR